MKKLLLLATLFSGFSAVAQEYEWVNMLNPDYEPYSVSDAEFLNGKLYQVYDSTGFMEVAEYISTENRWQTLAHVNVGYCNQMQVEAVGNYLYILTENDYSWKFARFDQATSILTTLNAPPGYYIPSNWEFKAGDSDDKLFLLWLNNSDTIELSHYNTTTLNWDNYSLNSTLNPSVSSLASYKLELYPGSTNVYAGITGTNNYIGFAPYSNLAGFQTYNSGAGAILLNSGNAIGNGYFAGDGSAMPEFHVSIPSQADSYETTLGATANIVPGTTPAFGFMTAAQDWTTFFSPANSYVISNFGVGSPNQDKFYLYQFDLATTTYDSVGPKIETGNPTLGSNQLTADLSDDGKHVVTTYKTSSAANWTYKVLNHQSYVSNFSISSGLCMGRKNLIYPSVELSDADGEEVRIVSLTSLNGHITNIFAQQLYFNTAATATTVFSIYGTITSQSTDAVIVTYTDGWNTYTDTLQSFQATGPVPPLAFLDNPTYICNNEEMVNLDDYMVYTTDGTFSFNGTALPTSTFDATQYPGVTSGTLTYEVNINGCYVEAVTTIDFVTPGTATATTTDATCGNNDGTATVSYTPGSATDYTLTWSTGEGATAINGLSAGQYTATFVDNHGCHTTAMAMVQPSGVTVTPTITNVSCPGASDGALSLAISGMSTYTILWSNGMSQPAISGIPAGNYQAAISDGNCVFNYSVNVAAPTAITAQFSLTEPDCGALNGAVNTTVTGDGPMTYAWSGNSATTANLSNISWGAYLLEIIDVHGCVADFPVNLNENQAAVLTDSLMRPSCQGNDGAIDLTATVNPLNNHIVTYNWSNGETTQDLLGLPAGTYSVVAIVGPNGSGQVCHSYQNIALVPKPPVRQDICMVTVDLNTTTNLVIWEKAEDAEHVSYYNIYRENGIAGDYMLIDTVQYGSESVFNDVVANPMNRSWRYKISAVNECGMEGTISTGHKTLHLNSIQLLSDGSYDIYWDEYEGLIGLNYVVNRYSDQNGWEALDPLYPMGTTFSHDNPAGLTGVDYYVEMIPTSTCTAEKAQDFNSSRSNKDKGNFYAGSGTGDSSNGLNENALNDIQVYPNPASSFVAITQEYDRELNIELLATNGTVLLTGKLNGLSSQLNIESIASGLYLLKIKGKGTQRVVRFIKN